MYDDGAMGRWWEVHRGSAIRGFEKSGAILDASCATLNHSRLNCDEAVGEE